MESKFYLSGKCKNNPGTGAYGILTFRGEEKLPEKFVISENTTNNRLILQAALIAIRSCPRTEPIIIHTNNELVFKTCTEWMFNWFAENVKKHIANRDLIESICLETKTRQVEWVLITSKDPWQKHLDTICREYLFRESPRESKSKRRNKKRKLITAEIRKLTKRRSPLSKKAFFSRRRPNAKNYVTETLVSFQLRGGEIKKPRPITFRPKVEIPNKQIPKTIIRRSQTHDVV